MRLGAQCTLMSVVTIVVLWTTPTYAIQCLIPEWQFDRAEQIFVAEVTAIEDCRIEKNPNSETVGGWSRSDFDGDYSDTFHCYRFDVIDVFKGAQADQITFFEEKFDANSNVSANFLVGTHYLLMEVGVSPFYAHPCSSSYTPDAYNVGGLEEFVRNVGLPIDVEKWRETGDYHRLESED